ncbi:Subtilase family protein [Chitinophaga jiangningensis]|uniref:Subtilase family protein n=1 Tax=Chitinophaga jiangningensis TaxID=1419482 RepID=A0A1M7GBR7_9BACT|nr:S8 family serine peptidase [Chitinophaga jiangningensis]SHM13538.1 Subtilase family protein [Chitinophaga jiangningensis]
MKPRNLLLLLLIIAIIIVLFLLRRCKGPEPVKKITRTDSAYASPQYHKDQLVLIFKHTPTTEERTRIKDSMRVYGIDTVKITVQACPNCKDMPVELWNAPGIDTYVFADPVRGGTTTGSGTQGQGEDSTSYYSRNFILNAPPDLDNRTPAGISKLVSRRFVNNGKVIRVAILDTGLDEALLNTGYTWKNPAEKPGNQNDDDANCLKDDVVGWNFVGNNSDIRDDHPGRHGSNIALFIMNEFQRDSANALQLMILKTHDQKAQGDLFNAMCAIAYAASHDARIINASWGYYTGYKSSPYRPLDSMITRVLAEKGILFVTSAGNRMPAADDSARKRGLTEAELRDLTKHQMYPACFNNPASNIIVATTINDTAVSPTQNFSDRYVDIGVKADSIENGVQLFRVPLVLENRYITGSSFATAIVTGRIAAMCPVPRNGTTAKKEDFLNNPGINAQYNPVIGGKKQVAGGRYITHN